MSFAKTREGKNFTKKYNKKTDKTLRIINFKVQVYIFLEKNGNNKPLFCGYTESSQEAEKWILENPEVRYLYTLIKQV